MKLIVNESLQAAFRRRAITSSLDTDTPWSIGDELFVPDDAELEPYCNIQRSTQLPRRMGAFSYSVTSTPKHLRVGRYSSISWNVDVLGSRHPVDWASTSPFSYAPWLLRSLKPYLVERDVTLFLPHAFDPGAADVNIGHDVWIGADVMLGRCVTVGHGAVIAARSVVTHDVPPYAVVGGVPARVIRYRFAPDLIERLLALEWWRYGPEVLHPLDVRDPEGFVSRLEAVIFQGEAQPLKLEPFTAAQMQRAAAGDPTA
jgi:acetyltransferase-like isoleucine patch superfamily enzyme